MTPIKLGVEPIVDAVFEAWVVPGQFPLPSIVPGVLVGKFGNGLAIERLPAADIPAVFRESREELRHQPHVRISWGQFIVNVGERVIGVGCTLPYPGWAEFKKIIVDIFDLIAAHSLVESVERYSMKYVDLIRDDVKAKSKRGLDVEFRIGGKAISDQIYTFKSEFASKDLIQVLTLVSQATVQIRDSERQFGSVVDIDTISTEQHIDYAAFVNGLSDRAERLHTANKEMFFSCLSPELTEAMEPKYA